jgi:hypothetical protein
VRNNLIFNGIAATKENCKQVFKQIFGMVIHRAKKKYFPAIVEWLELIV